VRAVIFDWGGTLTPWRNMDYLTAWRAYADQVHPSDQERAATLAEAIRTAEEAAWQRAREEHLAFTIAQVLDAAGAPVFSALVKVHVAYGFHGLHKLDLSAYTNAQGKTKFKGLPARAYKPPVEFRATKDAMTGTAWFNPETECEARHEIVVKNGK